LNPRLTELVVLARRHWPSARLRLVTNGFFLHRHPELPRTLRHSNSFVDVSIHHGSAEYQARLAPVRDLVQSWRRQGVQVNYVESYKNWTRRYKGQGPAMEPYEDGRPRQSWEHCPAKHAKQLFEGKLFKCAPLTYLRLQHARHGLSEKWQPYLTYQPLSPDCSDKELRGFCAREEEIYCSMCPAQPERFILPIPLRGNSGADDRPSPPAATPAWRQPLQMVRDWLSGALPHRP
jgi:hypothetical protein